MRKKKRQKEQERRKECRRTVKCGMPAAIKKIARACRDTERASSLEGAMCTHETRLSAATTNPRKGRGLNLTFLASVGPFCVSDAGVADLALRCMASMSIRCGLVDSNVDYACGQKDLVYSARHQISRSTQVDAEWRTVAEILIVSIPGLQRNACLRSLRSIAPAEARSQNTARECGVVLVLCNSP